MSTIAQTALHLDLSERRFRELVDEGVIPRAARGEYDLDATRTIYIRHLREQAAGRNKPGTLDPGQERALKDRAQRELAEFSLAVERGEMVRIEEIGGQMEQAFGVVRTRLLALPGKFGGDLSPEQVARIEAEVRDALEELHARGAEPERS